MSLRNTYFQKGMWPLRWPLASYKDLRTISYDRWDVFLLIRPNHYVYVHLYEAFPIIQPRASMANFSSISFLRNSDRGRKWIKFDFGNRSGSVSTFRFECFLLLIIMKKISLCVCVFFYYYFNDHFQKAPYVSVTG